MIPGIGRLNTFPPAIDQPTRVFYSGQISGPNVRVLTSDDHGLTFTVRHSPTLNNIAHLARGPVVVSGVGSSGYVIGSTDNGDTFSTIAASGSTSTNYQGNGYGAARFVRSGGNGSNQLIDSSLDGSTWTNRQSFTGSTIKGVSFANGYFIVAQSSAGYRYSSDGENWTTGSIGGSDFVSESFAYGNGVYVAVGLSVGDLHHVKYASAVGGSWTGVGLGVGLNGPVSVAFSPALGLFVAVGANSNIWSSPNGASWTLRTSPYAAIHRRVCWTGQAFLVGSHKMARSIDGTSFTEITLPITMNDCTSLIAG